MLLYDTARRVGELSGQHVFAAQIRQAIWPEKGTQPRELTDMWATATLSSLSLRRPF